MAQPQQPQGLHSLSTIIKRLEAVTSRLEDVAVSQQATISTGAHRSPTSAIHDNHAGALAGVAAGGAAGAGAGAAAASAGAPPPPPPPPPPPAEEELSPAVKAYNSEIIEGPFAEFIANAKKVGGIVQQGSLLYEPLVKAQFEYLKMASGVQKPAQSSLPALLKPQADAIGAIVEAKDKLGRSKEGREWGAALSVLGEGAGAWGWVQVEPAPAPFVGEMKDSTQFWVDRVVKQYKDSNPDAAAWARSFPAVITAMQKYVKQWHTTGVVWNPKGPAAPASVPSSAAPAAPAAPPPPAARASNGGGGGGGQAALLADLNKGGAITSGLRKVDSSMQTHKNPELRASSTVPDKLARSPSRSSPPPIKAKPAGFSKQPAKKPPRTELEDGNKWLIEYHEDNRNIVIDQTSITNTVHLFNCKNTVVQILGKVNAITMLNCKKTSIVLESAVSSLSITSSPSFEVQVTGTIPTILIDNTDSGQVYLSKECAEIVEVVTAKTSAININIPTDEQGDYKEAPVPEQMRSKIVNGKLVTEIVEHAG